MSTGSKGVEVCRTESGEYYVRNEAVINDILNNVRQGHFSTILGPRYCQKSQLLRDVKTRLEAACDDICVLLDLQDYGDRTDNDVLRDLAVEIDRKMRERTTSELLASPSDVVDEHSLKRFFSWYVSMLGRDLVFFIDHLEYVRPGPVNSLLRALRAVYNERRTKDSCRLGVVIASSLMVSGLLLGETSPFNIAQLTLVRDLTRNESAKLVHSIFKESEAEVSKDGLDQLLQAAGGDRYLLQQLCKRCLNQTAADNNHSLIHQADIVKAIDWIVEANAEHSPPLKETIDSLADDSENLMNVLRILERGEVPRRDLKLGLDLIWDSLQLTGAVSVETRGEEKIYRIRNEIYYSYLKVHFTPDRIAHFLSMAGQWESAIDYLEQVVATDRSARSTLLGTILDSIYGARSAPQAYEKLALRLSRAFTLRKVGIYILSTERTRLSLVSEVGFDDKITQEFSLDETSRPEVRAFFSRHYEVSQSAHGEVVTLIPFLRDQWQTLGVASVYGLDPTPNQPDFQDLLAFLKRLGRALGSPIQLSAFYETVKQVTGFHDLQQTMQTTVDEAIKAVPGSQRGSLLLWDPVTEYLDVRVQRGYRESFAADVRMGKGVGYVGKVFESGEPIRMGDVMGDPRTSLRTDADISLTKSMICVPLRSWGGMIGVLCLDNITAHNAFQKSDLELLSAFADQAANAIQNAQLSAELNELGNSVNRGDLELRQIFQQVVKSITRVSGAKAATLIMVPDELDEKEILAKAVLSISDGLGPDYDAMIRPRPNGLTLNVIRQGKPIAVSHPKDGIGINPLSRKQGIRAEIGLPMIHDEKIIGVLFVLHDKFHEFSERETKMLSLFANQAAMAINDKRLRDQLRIQDTRLAQEEALRVTARMVAHRLRNVLPIISDRIHRCLERAVLVDEGVRWGQVALTEARRAQRIVRDFETFSRSESFQRPDVLSGEESVRKLAEVVKETLVSDSAQVETRIEPGLPTVKLNFDKLSDDFANFARDSEHHKNTDLRITIIGERYELDDTRPLPLRPGTTYLRLVYMDNGPGIPREIKQAVFDPFHTTTDGSGLGLAIARHTAKVHDGILIECGPVGGGVRFEEYIPAMSQTPGEEAVP